jgi:hypothetical protein
LLTTLTRAGIAHSITMAWGVMARRLNSGGTRIDPDSVRLESGSHRSPGEGVCLLELTSVLARERFSDRPRCVCEVIAAFLRGWNDRSSHAERQRLRPYAKRLIGSRAGHGVTRRRRDLCLVWAGADLGGNALSRAIRRLRARLRILSLCGLRPALRLNEGAGELASRVVFSRYDFETRVWLVDTLLEMGADEEDSPGSGDRDPTWEVVERALRDRTPPPLESSNGNGNGHGRLNGNGHADGNGHANGDGHRGARPERVAAID